MRRCENDGSIFDDDLQICVHEIHYNSHVRTRTKNVSHSDHVFVTQLLKKGVEGEITYGTDLDIKPFSCTVDIIL